MRPWIPFVVPPCLTDSAHDMADKLAYWTEISDPLLERLRAAGYHSARIMTRKDMNNTPWIIVDEDIRIPQCGWGPLFWEITRHSGLYAGCANGNDAQLIHFQQLYKEGLDETHGYRGWTTAPCRDCFPARHAAAKSADAAAVDARQASNRRRNVAK